MILFEDEVSKFLASGKVFPVLVFIGNVLPDISR
jgi:hypothetical protein